jgi:hypothetical protein
VFSTDSVPPVCFSVEPVEPLFRQFRVLISRRAATRYSSAVAHSVIGGAPLGSCFKTPPNQKPPIIPSSHRRNDASKRSIVVRKQDALCLEINFCYFGQMNRQERSETIGYTRRMQSKTGNGKALFLESSLLINSFL